MGGLQVGLDFFDLWLCYKIDSLTSQWKVFVKKFDFPKFLMLNLDFFDFPG